MQAPGPLSRLLSDDELSLADWYGEPLPADLADAWAERLQRPPSRACPDAARCFRERLAELVARYWSGRDAAMSYRSLAVAAEPGFERALLELCYGQLLLARKLAAASGHLERGFALAAHLLAPDDYFRVMKRHHTLSVLVLSDRPAEPCGLQALLREARVIERLLGPGARGISGPPRGHRQDTLG